MEKLNKLTNKTIFLLQSSAGGGSSLQVHAVRFGPGQELLGSLQTFVEERRLRAPFIITCVGSVTKATLRLANATSTNTNEVKYCLTVYNHKYSREM